MKTSAIFLLLVLAFSCKEDDLDKERTGAIKASVCGVNYPIRELPWLGKLVREARDRKEDKMLTVKLFEVNGKPIFNYYISYMSCIGCISYQCDGSRIDVNKLSAVEIEEYNNKIVQGAGKTTVLWPEK